MNKSIIALTALAMTMTTASAQVVKVDGITPLLAETESNIFFPVISADGASVTFTAADHSNARRLSLADGITTKLKSAAPAKNAAINVSTEGSQLLLNRNGIVTKLSPVESYAGYLWASLSPDATKILFFAAGKGAFVIDLNGKILASLGNYEYPSWLGNNAVVAMRATDDGHQFASSQIVAISVSSGEMQQLTRPESMTMYPTATADGSTIVYNSIDGRLFKMSVKPSENL